MLLVNIANRNKESTTVINLTQEVKLHHNDKKKKKKQFRKNNEHKEKKLEKYVLVQWYMKRGIVADKESVARWTG